MKVSTSARPGFAHKYIHERVLYSVVEIGECWCYDLWNKSVTWYEKYMMCYVLHHVTLLAPLIKRGAFESFRFGWLWSGTSSYILYLVSCEEV